MFILSSEEFFFVHVYDLRKNMYVLSSLVMKFVYKKIVVEEMKY